MSSSQKNVLSANGFGRGSLTVVEPWALYHERYPIPPDVRTTKSSGGWKMTANGIVVPSPSAPDTHR
jgi:hypothetical protein